MVPKVSPSYLALFFLASICFTIFSTTSLAVEVKQKIFDSAADAVQSVTGVDVSDDGDSDISDILVLEGKPIVEADILPVKVDLSSTDKNTKKSKTKTTKRDQDNLDRDIREILDDTPYQVLLPIEAPEDEEEEEVTEDFIYDTLENHLEPSSDTNILDEMLGVEQPPFFSSLSNSNTNKQDVDSAPRRQQNALRAGVNHSEKIFTPAYGSVHETAYFFSDAFIGWPDLQRQSLILDTGSSVVGFPCQSCKNCGDHADEKFNCAVSENCKPMKCKDFCHYCDAQQKRCAYRVAYMEGSSLQGFWNVDTMRFGDKDAEELTLETMSRPIPTPFGCHVEETHLFVDQYASGILGLELWTQFGPETFIESALDIDGDSGWGPLIKDQYLALCFSEEGGVMALGSANDQYHTKKQDTLWTNIGVLDQSYTVQLSGGRVNNYKLDIIDDSGTYGSKNAEVLVDSGTTLTYVPFLTYKQILATIEKTSSTVVPALRRLKISGEMDDKVSKTNPDGNGLLPAEDLVVGGFGMGTTAKGQVKILDYPDVEEAANKSVEGVEDNKIDEVERRLSNGEEFQVNEYNSLDNSAPSRRARAVKVSTNTGEECWFMRNGDEDLKYFPTIYLSFQEVDGKTAGKEEIAWHPSSYLYQKGSDNYRCLAISPDESSGNKWILGGSFFINHDIIFDLRALRIGFVEATCPKYKIEDRRKSPTSE